MPNTTRAYTVKVKNGAPGAVGVGKLYMDSNTTVLGTINHGIQYVYIIK